MTRLGDIFCREYASAKSANQPGLHAEFAVYRSQLAQTLYYRLMENILASESKLKVDKGDLNVSELNIRCLLDIPIRLWVCNLTFLV